MQRRFALLPVLAAGALLLAGCADRPASAAAVVGSEQLPLNEVTGQLDEVTLVVGQTVTDPEFTRALVRNNVVNTLVAQAAADAGVAVDATAVDRAYADQLAFYGSQEALDRQAAENAIAPSMIEDDLRTALLARAMADQLTAAGVPQEEADQQVFAQVQTYSEAVGTTINPRFGVWDVQNLGITLDPNAPSAPAGPALGQLVP